MGEESSGDLGEEREELSEDGGAEELEDVLKAAARRAGLYRSCRLAWIAL